MKIMKIAVTPSQNETKLNRHDRDIKKIERDIKEVKSDLKKLVNKIDDLNLGQRKFWQHVSPLNSLQRKVERFEQVEREFNRLKDTLDSKIKKQVNKHTRPNPSVNKK